MRALSKFVVSAVLLLSMFALMVSSPVYASPAYESVAFVAYRSSTSSGTSFPKNRVWSGTAWGTENEMATAQNPVRWVRVAYCPNGTRYYEKIVVTLSDDGNLDAYVWTGAAWSVSNNIASTGVAANAYRAFDIAYESATGRALLVYSKGSATDGQELGYKIWNGASWSAESLVTGLPTAGTGTVGVVYWVALASKTTNAANDIAMIILDDQVDVHGMLWTGSAWSNMGHGTASGVWDATGSIATKESIAVAYEQISGDALFIWADATTDIFNYRTWDGSTLGSVTTLTITDMAAAGYWVVLKPRPGSDGLLFGVVDSSENLNTRYWSGTAWDSATEHPEHDSSTDPADNSRIFDLDWAPDGSHALLAYGDGSSGDSLNWRKGTPTTGATWWSAATEVAAGNDVAWVQLKSNPRLVSGDIKILGVVSATNNDIGSLKWDGTTLTPARTAFATATGVTTYECFDLEFQNYLLASLYVWPAAQSVAAPFDVYVNVTAPDPLYAWELKLYYNTTILTATSVTLGPFLNDSAGGTPNTFGTKSINDSYNATHGRVYVSQTMIGDRPGGTGTGKSLVRIGFSLDFGPATSFLRPRETILVGYRTDRKVTFTIPYSVTDGTATVTVSPVPEFPLGFMLEIALAGVVVYFWWKHKAKTKPNIPSL